MGNILIIVKSYEHVKFFLRMKDSLEKLNYNIIFVTLSYASYRMLSKHNETVFLVKKVKKIIKINKCYKNSLEFKVKFFSKNLINNIYNSSYFKIKEIINKYNIDYFFIWNGSEIIDKAAKDIAIEYNIKTLYFEISNLSGKIFVDPFGTNAASKLYKDKTILKKYRIDPTVYNSWEKRFIKENLKMHIVKQGNLKFAPIGQFFWNRVGELFITKFFCCRNVFEKIKKYLYYRKGKFVYKKYNLNNPYIFFPLQVSTDTQIIIHSDINLKDALTYAISRAKKLNLDLLVKPHPAEYDSKFVNKLLADKKIILVDDNTFKLIKNALEVITINSTVGLEAKIMNKSVKVLGKAFYKNFDRNDIERYICGYLVDIDYFSDSLINKAQVKKLLDRAELNYG